MTSATSARNASYAPACRRRASCRVAVNCPNCSDSRRIMPTPRKRQGSTPSCSCCRAIIIIRSWMSWRSRTDFSPKRLWISRARRLSQHLTHARDHLAAVQLDARHQPGVRQRARAVYHVEARCAQPLHGCGDLARHGFRRAEIERAVYDLALELRLLHRRPAALLADAVAHALIGQPEFLARLFVSRSNITRRMHAERLNLRFALLMGATVKIDERREALRIAADDRKHQRQLVIGRTHHRLRRAADADPRLQPPVLNRREDALVDERRTDRTFPGDRLLLEHLDEQIELLLKQLLVLIERKTEQRNGFGERAAPENDFRAAVRGRIKRRETLKHPDRIVRRQHRDGGAEADTFCLSRDRGPHSFRRGDREFITMMFAKADEVDAETVGENGLLDHVADDLCMRQQSSRRIGGHIAERI